jgi:protein involved in polysaccharide export with SLBB domain
MIKSKLVILLILSTLLFQGCSKILEPISLESSIGDIKDKIIQEEFSIDIEGLTFKTASQANTDPYERKLMINGSGQKANVLDENFYLKTNIPKSKGENEYTLGYGDVLLFSQIKEFINEEPQWPSEFELKDYILGIGDELTFSNLIEVDTEYAVLNDGAGNILTTSGIIGSNGKVLLLGMGNMIAAGRTLNDIRNDVRNILIRNGSSPNFQLEITNFESQKVFMNFKIQDKNTYPIMNIPTTLQQLILLSGLSDLSEDTAIIILNRKRKEYRLTARQLFDADTPDIYLQHNDSISIDVSSKKYVNEEVRVGAKGDILLPEVGSIDVFGKSLKDVHEIVRQKFITKGIVPNFQLEITDFKSKKVYLIANDTKKSVIPLTNSKVSLKELIFENITNLKKPNNLMVINLKRNKKIFRLTLDMLLDVKTPSIWIQDNDQIEIKNLTYKKGQVFVLSGAGRAQIIPIDPSIRETLANILFIKGGPLENLFAKRSEIYLLRGRDPVTAYHLDAQNVSRILVASKTELRPNDIIYAADRPIISFSRLLDEITPLRILLRDIKEDNIP